MSSLAPASTRSERLERIVEALPQRASALSKLLLIRTGAGVSRTEAGVMRALSERPQRITELAAREQVTQPAITLLVNRLQDRGWATRETDPSDGRAVLVRLTAAGREAFTVLLAEYRAILHAQLLALPDRDIATLARSMDIFAKLIESLMERDQ